MVVSVDKIVNANRREFVQLVLYRHLCKQVVSSTGWILVMAPGGTAQFKPQPDYIDHPGRPAHHDSARRFGSGRVPHNQGEQFYMTPNKACKNAPFRSLPKAPHRNWMDFSSTVRFATTMRSTSSLGWAVVNATPFKPSWNSVIDFLDKYVKM